jgi:fructose-specific phosphotransferase system IIC component
MNYSLGVLAYGLIFSAPGWAVAFANAGGPGMWAGFAAGSLAYLPFVATACFPRAIEAVVAEH